MTRERLITLFAAVLTTLSEVDHGSPESILYLGIGGDIEEWNEIKSILLKLKLIECKGHYVTLTASGKEKAIELEEALKKRAEFVKEHVVVSHVGD